MFGLLSSVLPIQVAAAAAETAAPQPSVASVTESWTGVAFPTVLPAGAGAVATAAAAADPNSPADAAASDAAAAAQVLAGVAVRCMMGRCEFEVARVYAVGLYVEEATLAALPVTHSAVRDASLGAAEFEAAVADAIVANRAALPGDISLVLEFSKAAGGKHVAKGFDKSLVKRLRAAHNGIRRNKSKPHLKTFTNALKRHGTLPEGTRIVMTWKDSDAGSGLVLTINDDPPIVIDDPILAREAFGLYLDAESNFRKYPTMKFKLAQDATA